MQVDLEATLHRELPLSRDMGVQVEEASGEGVRLQFPLGPNRNHMGNGFGGSLYSAAVLAGWSLLWCAARERDVAVQVLIVEGGERFLAPVTADFRSECTIDAAALDKAFRTFQRRGKAKLELDCVVFCGLEACLAFRGTYGLVRATA